MRYLMICWILASCAGETKLDEELLQQCAVTCDRFKECAQSTYDRSYASDKECTEFCAYYYGRSFQCKENSLLYLDCNANLECSQWDDLLMDPNTTSCSDEWELVKTSCELQL